MTLLLASCTEDFKDWATPQSNPQGEMVAFGNGSVAAVDVIDLAEIPDEGVPQGAKLQISSVGYDTHEVTASSDMVITLAESTQMLENLVVIGYGVVKKNDLTGSVTALKPDAKNKGVVVSAQDMLGGKVAGVSVTSNSGEPGGGANIRIRGGSSLNASNNPLIVIDGIAMDNNGVSGLSNPLSLVNPQDIESFNVLG